LLPHKQTIVTWPRVLGGFFLLVALSVTNNILFFEIPVVEEETLPYTSNRTVGSIRPVKVLSSTSHSSNASEEGWWTPLAKSVSTVWPEIDKDRPKCFPVNRSIWKDTPSSDGDGLPPRGFLYVKSYKASSSTCEGINIALAYHLAPSLEYKCEHYDRHKFADEKWHAQRKKVDSLLWTMVRHPKARDVSQVYHFRVSRGGMKPFISPNFWEALGRQKSVQVKYLGVRRDMPQEEIVVDQNGNSNNDILRWIQEAIMEEYDFIGVTERMSTSLAVMSLLWDIDPTVFIVLNAKQSRGGGGGYDAGGRKKKCTKLIPPPNPFPTSLTEYLNSSSYQQNHWDFVLYHAVNASLDLTIEKLGKDRVAKHADLISRMQQIAEEKCRPKAIFPCSSEGIFQEEISNCYIQDSGCGYECVDEVLRDYRREKIRL